jgi:hypothetical protein
MTEPKWIISEDRREYRNIPINLAERRALMQGLFWGFRNHRKLKKLEAEFNLLYKHGVIYKKGSQ